MLSQILISFSFRGVGGLNVMAVAVVLVLVVVLLLMMMKTIKKQLDNDGLC